MKYQIIADKSAIALSTLCIIHCLLLPVFLLVFPSVILATLSDEAFHFWMLFFIVPISILALLVGFRHHHNYRLLAFGIFGLAVIIIAFLFGHDWLGHEGEVGLTVLGSLIIAIAHFKNSRLKRETLAHFN